MFLEDQYRLSAISATEALFKAYAIGNHQYKSNFTAEKLVSINTKLQITFVIMGQLRLIWYTTKRQVIIYHWLGIYF
jgi:hypothetical protein